MDAIITINTALKTDDGDDAIEVVTQGQYDCDNGITRISYDESELTGMEGTHTSFTVEGGSAIMTREGSVNTQVVFRTGEKHYFMYSTPEGMHSMGIHTRCISSELDKNGGRLEIQYNIDVAGSFISRNDVVIKVREVQ